MTYRLSERKVRENSGLLRMIQAVVLDATDPMPVKLHCEPGELSRTQYQISEVLKSAEVFSEEFRHLRSSVRVKVDSVEKCILIESRSAKASMKGPVHSLLEPHDLEGALSLLSAYGGSSTPVALSSDVDIDRFTATTAILGWEVLSTMPMKTFPDGSKLVYVSKVEDERPKVGSTSVESTDLEAMAARLGEDDDDHR